MKGRQGAGLQHGDCKGSKIGRDMIVRSHCLMGM